MNEGQREVYDEALRDARERRRAECAMGGDQGGGAGCGRRERGGGPLRGHPPSPSGPRPLGEDRGSPRTARAPERVGSGRRARIEARIRVRSGPGGARRRAGRRSADDEDARCRAARGGGAGRLGRAGPSSGRRSRAGPAPCGRRGDRRSEAPCASSRQRERPIAPVVCARPAPRRAPCEDDLEPALDLDPSSQAALATHRPRSATRGALRRRRDLLPRVRDDDHGRRADRALAPVPAAWARARRASAQAPTSGSRAARRRRRARPRAGSCPSPGPCTRSPTGRRVATSRPPSSSPRLPSSTESRG